MTDVEFVQAVNKIRGFLGYQGTIQPHVLSAMHDKLQGIPSEAVPYIVRRITDEAESLPRNLPKLFRELHCQWLAENPQRASTTLEHYCGQCYDGILWLQRGGVTAAIFCACYRGNPGQVGKTTVAAMRAQGWTLIDLTGHGTPEMREAMNNQLHNARMDYSHPDYRRADHYAYEDSPFA